MSAYQELVERCESMVAEWLNIDNPPGDDPTDLAKAIIAEVLRTLETVTPEMRASWIGSGDIASEVWVAMLRASPVSPP